MTLYMLRNNTFEGTHRPLDTEILLHHLRGRKHLNLATAAVHRMVWTTCQSVRTGASGERQSEGGNCATLHLPGDTPSAGRSSPCAEMRKCSVTHLYALVEILRSSGI